MKKIKGLLIIGALLAATATITLTPGCAKTTLEQGGAYAPVTTNADGTVTPTAQADKGLYVADASFELAYSALETTFKIERDNRALLWKISPDIKHGLDAIRPKAVDIKLKYAKARAVYLAHPIPAGLDTVNEILAEAQALSDAAQAALPKN